MRDFAGEGEKGRPHRILQPAVGHHHVEDRLRFVRHLFPHADGLKQAPGRGGNGGGSGIGHVGTRKSRIGNRHRKAFAERLAQSDAEREAGEAAPAHQDVDLLSIACRHYALNIG